MLNANKALQKQYLNQHSVEKIDIISHVLCHNSYIITLYFTLSFQVNLKKLT